MEGQFKDCKGFITLIQDGFVTFKTEEAKPFEVKTRAHIVKKCFKIGESVRIIQGNRAGEPGVISQILKDSRGQDSHAVITMMDDSCHSELTILINNLRLKKEIDPNTQASINTEYFQRNFNSITYQAGELIMFENYKKLGLII
jgi:transcription elongation factor